MENMLKTGTTTVGIVCKDAVILAADTRATAGTMIVDKRAKKVHIITEDVAATIAGSVSEAQLLLKLIKAELKLKEVRTNRKATMKEAANLLGGLLYSTLRRMSMFPAVAHFLLAGKDKQGVHLYDLFPDGSVTEISDYVSSGSGSVFAYGVLESHWNPDMSSKEGINLAIKSVNAALQRDSASGNGIDIVMVDKHKIEKVLKKELVYSL
ncbi:proteasome subunit beta [archaeon]|jgi:proteasome beta subunit|nr:proteasome subunit beta [archaeon]MBT3450612.1 proteasome subunit beta [archaeon]MBT6868702.1 proteasome subunit beta [archaeon]MBT7193490.1 proteasome subunit beta [archaeon]MBT7381081.1 proteasome subunit beta [archaeon]